VLNKNTANWLTVNKNRINPPNNGKNKNNIKGPISL
jgi:hypothetical protein